MFTHIGFAPRNSSLMNFYIDGGLNYKGLFPTRDNDVFVVAFAYGHLSNNPQENDRGSFPGHEMVVEATYQMELTPWLTLQPDVQSVIHPFRGRYRERSGLGGPSDRLLLKGTPAIR
jgi:porin